MKAQLLLTILICGLLCSCKRQDNVEGSFSAKEYLEAGEEALERDSVLRGETLLRSAIEKAERTDDWHTCYIACQRLAESLSWSNTEEALRMAKKAIDVYERHPDDERNHAILLDCAGTYAAQLAYINEGSFDDALALTRQAYQIALDGGMNDLQCQTLTSLANIAWAEDDVHQALEYVLKAKPLATPQLIQGVLQVMGRCYMSLDSLDKAEEAYRQMKTDDDIHSAYIVQSNLAKIAALRYGAEEAEEAIDSAFERVEQLYFKVLEQKDDYYQTVVQQERENERLAYTSSLHRRMFVAGIIIFFFLTCGAWLLMRYRMKLIRQQRQHERERHEQETRLNEQKNRLLRQETEMQQERLKKADEVIAFLQSYILQRTEVVRKLSQTTDAHITLSEREWGEVERTLNAIDDDRIKRIRQMYPDMDEDDIRLCVLTRLQLTNRTIGNLYCISISAVQHRKLKLKKDVFGEKDPDITLEQVIMNS